MKGKMVTVVLVVLLFLCLLMVPVAKGAEFLFAIPAVIIVIVLWARRKRKPKATPAPATPQPAAAPATPSPAAHVEFDSLRFKVTGVTFNGRQTYLQKIDEYEEPFVGCGFDIQETEYKGEPAFQIVATLDNGGEKVVGFVPKELIPKVEAVKDRISLVEVEVYGGDAGKSYGASCEISWPS